MATSQLKVKLLVDKKAQKVLFAEAGKQVVDFLFNLLALPLGTVVKLLTKDSMLGSLGNIYNSVENLSEAFIEPNQAKVFLLEPKIHTCVAQVPLLVSIPKPTPKAIPNHYSCSKCNEYVTTIYGTNCMSCEVRMTKMLIYVRTETPKEEPRGYVKGLVTYMVMDDLSVTPIVSTISSMTFLNKFKVGQFESFEEKVFDLGMDEALALLKASLLSKTVLTDVFLGKNLKRLSGESSTK